jgi:hypothetical protein
LLYILVLLAAKENARSVTCRRNAKASIHVPLIEVDRIHQVVGSNLLYRMEQVDPQLLSQIADRGEAAIAYDPAMEYLPQFYNEQRDDVVLNPMDARCPSGVRAMRFRMKRRPLVELEVLLVAALEV